MRGIAVVALMQMVRAKPMARRLLGHGAPAGTFGCLVRTVHYWSGPRKGETETLQGGDWELDIITDQNLLWERESGESVHNGLPIEIIESLPFEQRLRIPMLPQSRSMNLANAVAVFVYESWRQFGYEGSL